ncbi:MAG: hypothetical protein KY466_14195, partial [Gemmatimonadetes bacterium]|nr:hypothetical protein [Gemmatimonadota bacterium]
MTRRAAARALVALAALAALGPFGTGATGAAAQQPAPPRATGDRPIVVASKPFAESYLLAEMFA